MKLKMNFFDFEKCEIGFSVPPAIMGQESFCNVPGGVEVDLGAITGNAALGIKKLDATTSNSAMVEMPPSCGNCLMLSACNNEYRSAGCLNLLSAALRQ